MPRRFSLFWHALLSIVTLENAAASHVTSPNIITATTFAATSAKTGSDTSFTFELPSTTSIGAITISQQGIVSESTERVGSQESVHARGETSSAAEIIRSRLPTGPNKSGRSSCSRDQSSRNGGQAIHKAGEVDQPVNTVARNATPPPSITEIEERALTRLVPLQFEEEAMPGWFVIAMDQLTHPNPPTNSTPVTTGLLPNENNSLDDWVTQTAPIHWKAILFWLLKPIVVCYQLAVEALLAPAYLVVRWLKG